MCGYLGQKVSWHVGFAAAGVGMTLGVIQYVVGSRNLGDAGLDPAPAESPQAAASLRRNAAIVGALLVAAIAGFGIGAVPFQWEYRETEAVAVVEAVILVLPAQ